MFFKKKILDHYFKHLPECEFLLALSGGSDSIFLFFILKQYNINFQVAHIDHGWRDESSYEMVYIKQLCQDHNIVCHTKSLNKSLFQNGNAENVARDERYNFFVNICKSQNLLGVFVAQHADDQSETVLKRVFEGANLWNLGGMRPESKKDGLQLFRPLLSITKKEIIAFLQQHNIKFFDDQSNYDEVFLRARFRSKIIPSLEKCFGKNIVNPICQLSNYSYELSIFMNTIYESYKCLIHGNDHEEIDLSLKNEKTCFELKFVITKFTSGHAIFPSSATTLDIICHIQKLSMNKVFRVKGGSIFLNKGKLRVKVVNKK